MKTSPRIPCGSVFSLMEGCHKSFSGRSSERSRGSLPVLGKDKKTMAVTLRLFPTKDRDKDVSPLKRDLRRKGGDLVSHCINTACETLDYPPCKDRPS